MPQVTLTVNCLPVAKVPSIKLSVTCSSYTQSLKEHSWNFFGNFHPRKPKKENLANLPVPIPTISGRFGCINVPLCPDRLRARTCRLVDVRCSILLPALGLSRGSGLSESNHLRPRLERKASQFAPRCPRYGVK